MLDNLKKYKVILASNSPRRKNCCPGLELTMKYVRCRMWMSRILIHYEERISLSI